MSGSLHVNTIYVIYMLMVSALYCVVDSKAAIQIRVYRNTWNVIIHMTINTNGKSIEWGVTVALSGLYIFVYCRILTLCRSFINILRRIILIQLLSLPIAVQLSSLKEIYTLFT